MSLERMELLTHQVHVLGQVSVAGVRQMPHGAVTWKSCVGKEERETDAETRCIVILGHNGGEFVGE